MFTPMSGLYTKEYVTVVRYCISLYTDLLFFFMRLPHFYNYQYLVYNMDNWKQQKPFYLADNKASLVWIPWVFMAHSYTIQQILIRGQGVDSSRTGWGEATPTHQELERQASNTKSPAFPEYLVFNSHNINFTYIKIKGHWACGTFYYTFILVVYYGNRIFSLYPNWFSLSSSPTTGLSR